MADKKRLVVIDGKSVFYRGYYAMPNLAKKDGTPTGGVYGFAVMALEVLRKMEPDYVCVAWDKPKTNIARRVKIYPEYKANRKPAPPDFYEQVPILKDLLAAFKWPFYEIDDHEADDIMATFAKQAKRKGFESILVTSDKDVLQLVGPDITVATLKKGLSNVEMFDPKKFDTKYSMTPEQFIDYKSLRGDSSDNIPGVAGVGEKTATQLIQQWGSLEEIYKNIGDIKGSVQKKLIKDKESAYITRELIVLDSDVPLKLDWDKADVNNVDPEVVKSKLVELEFRSLLRKLPENMEQIEPKTDKRFASTSSSSTITKASELKKLKIDSKQVVIQIVADEDIQAIIISPSEKQVYAIDATRGIKPSELKSWLNGLKDKQIISHDTKKVLKALLNLGVDLPEVGHDVRIGAFLVNSLLKEQSLTALAEDAFGYEGPDLDELSGYDLINGAKDYSSVVWALYKYQQSQLDKMDKVADLAKDIEWPVMSVLAKMETRGIKLDVGYLKKMAKNLQDKISDIEQQVYGHANKEFNISSPQQLSEILFKDLKLPTENIKKTKTGFSTAASELEKLKGKHEVISMISEYRELTKLKNTYVDTLPEVVDDNSRIHTTFSMAIAPTGRLSSHDPNLQNIPVRTETGRQIRKAFIPEKGNVFVSADYSQFELRLAAVLAEDVELIESFNDGVDIHTRTAAQIYGVPLEDVSKDQRRDAKVINFGILYGMSPHGLSVATGMTQSDAKDFIERYFKLRQPLLDYIDKTKQQAKDRGYVETMFGRRRPTPDAHSTNFVVREAVNMPIQGTEADLMKMAMVEIENHLDEDCWQLLQIHDSILIECPKDKAAKVGKLVKGIMEGIHELPVNLDVDIEIGDNWEEV